MGNLLQSSQNKTTCVPSFYSNYLTNLACKGGSAQSGAQFIGAQPLQTKAFQTACQNAGTFQPVFQQGVKTLGCAANKNIAGAAAPYLSQALGTNTAKLAQCYMSPYISSAVNQMSDIANRNIQQNLDPMAVASTVGSGQFGSQRGAQVLGQVNANALQCLNANIANMENTGYNNALTAATQRQALLNQLASTAGTTTAECARAKQAAGLGMGTLGTQASQQNLACINALANLGAQCQTIKQNAQCYSLSTLAKLSGLLQGHQIPTNVKTTMCMSPLSAVGAVGSGVLGVLCKSPGIIEKLGCLTGLIKGKGKKSGCCGCGSCGSCGSCKSTKTKKPSGCKPSGCTPSGCNSCNSCCSSCCYSCCSSCCYSCCFSCCYSCCGGCWCFGCASGGLVDAKNRPTLGMTGCGSLRMLGALPVRRK
jgi:hypothetical protein